MKLAIVDHYKDSLVWENAERLIAGLTANGIEVYVAGSIKQFEDHYGPLDKYDGFLYHPGISQQLDLDSFQKRYPKLKWAFATTKIEDVEDGDEEGVMFDYSNVEGIRAYFSNSKNSADK